jgi:hypothetical protein
MRKEKRKRLEAKGWKIGRIGHPGPDFGIFAVECHEDQRRKTFHGMPSRVAGPKASKSLAVSSLDRVDKCDETLPRRRMEMQSKAKRSHKFSRLLVTCVLAPRSRRVA